MTDQPYDPTLEAEYLTAFELHSPDAIRRALAAGASPVALVKGQKPIDILIQMYTRSAQFADCLRVLLDAGASIDDPLLEAVLLDDAQTVQRIAENAEETLHRRLTVASAYTSCTEVTALHLCAEFNSVRCAAALLEAGVDVNVRAGTDSNGWGGQTPIFHAVNSNQNYCRPVMELLANAGATLDVRLKGLVWGNDLDWETVLFDVTLFSYAEAGLYRQFHRSEADIFSNIAFLHRKRYGVDPPIRNVPNRYLAS